MQVSMDVLAKSLPSLPGSTLDVSGDERTVRGSNCDCDLLAEPGSAAVAQMRLEAVVHIVVLAQCWRASRAVVE